MGNILDGLLESMKTMGIFLVCAQMLIHFKPKGNYEKYIRLLVSVMLLVQVMEPLGTILGLLDKGEIQKSIRDMELKLERVQEQSGTWNEKTEDIWSMLLEQAESEQIITEERKEE